MIVTFIHGARSYGCNGMFASASGQFLRGSIDLALLLSKIRTLFHPSTTPYLFPLDII
jgi:hypothetical protein